MSEKTAAGDAAAKSNVLTRIAKSLRLKRLQSMMRSVRVILGPLFQLAARIVVFGLVIASFATIVPVALTLFEFWSQNYESPTNAPADWGVVASFLGSMFQVIIGVTTAATALFITFVLSRKLDKRRDLDEQNRAAVRLSEMMYDKNFYVSVVGPSWEVVTKWLYWTGEGGDRYRLQVISEFIELEPTKFFEHPEEAESRRFHNKVRFLPHYTPYDVGGAVITELSEHMALTTWFKFWCHVDFLIERELISKDAVVELFKGWYTNWYPFMYEYRVAASILTREQRKSPKDVLKQLASLEESLGLAMTGDEKAKHDRRAQEIAEKALQRAPNRKTSAPKQVLDSA
jgi:hypothetical protein